MDTGNTSGDSRALSPEETLGELVDTSRWRLRDQPVGRKRRRRANEDRRVDVPLRGKLFQEDLLAEPYWMLVACSLVNLTNWETARPVHAGLMADYTVGEIAALDPEDLQERLRPLGLWRRRSESLIKLAKAWLERPPRNAADVRKLPGCGPYASDSWAIFIDGRTDVDPTDGKLRWFLERVACGEKKLVAPAE